MIKIKIFLTTFFLFTIIVFFILFINSRFYLNKYIFEPLKISQFEDSLSKELIQNNDQLKFNLGIEIIRKEDYVNISEILHSKVARFMQNNKSYVYSYSEVNNLSKKDLKKLKSISKNISLEGAYFLNPKFLDKILINFKYIKKNDVQLFLNYLEFIINKEINNLTGKKIKLNTRPLLENKLKEANALLQFSLNNLKDLKDKIVDRDRIYNLSKWPRDKEKYSTYIMAKKDLIKLKNNLFLNTPRYKKRLNQINDKLMIIKFFEAKKIAELDYNKTNSLFSLKEINEIELILTESLIIPNSTKLNDKNVSRVINRLSLILNTAIEEDLLVTTLLPKFKDLMSEAVRFKYTYSKQKIKIIDLMNQDQNESDIKDNVMSFNPGLFNYKKLINNYMDNIKFVERSLNLREIISSIVFAFVMSIIVTFLMLNFGNKQSG